MNIDQTIRVHLEDEDTVQRMRELSNILGESGIAFKDIASAGALQISPL